MIKEVLSREELYIQFTDEEIAELGWDKEQKLLMTLRDDGSIIITKNKTINTDESKSPEIIYIDPLDKYYS